jgi:hypothetical protein
MTPETHPLPIATFKTSLLSWRANWKSQGNTSDTPVPRPARLGDRRGRRFRPNSGR